MAASISIANAKKSKPMPEKAIRLLGSLNGSGTCENLPIHCPQPIRRKIIEEIVIQENDQVGFNILCDSPPPRPTNPQIPLMISPSSLVAQGRLCGSWLVRSNKSCILHIPPATSSVSPSANVTFPDVNSPKFRVAGFDVKGKDNRDL